MKFYQNKLWAKNESVVCIRRGKRIAPWCEYCAAMWRVVCFAKISCHDVDGSNTPKRAPHTMSTVGLSGYDHMHETFLFCSLTKKKRVLPTYKKISWVEPLKSLRDCLD